MHNKTKVPEKFLHYIWKYRLFEDSNLTDQNNNRIEIINQGTQNFDAGPDFFNAKIKINETIWAGNIEIHINSSDWKKHKHQNDRTYDNVILQIVLNNDAEIYRTNGEIIPTCTINFNNKLLEKYNGLTYNKDTISCSNEINQVNDFTIKSWLNSLMIERLENKTNDINRILSYTNNNWAETFYITLARSFGFKVNSDIFELTAKSLPSTILAKHKNNLFQIEALLFGQAGFLSENNCNDRYFIDLQKEYNFLKAKYKLSSQDNYLLKFLRLRPANFPTIRISQLAQLIHKSSHLFSEIIESKNIESIIELFKVQASNYWKTHYVFGKISSQKDKNIGTIAINTIIINTVIPLIFIYGKKQGNDIFTEKALDFLENLNPEKNKITKEWKFVGISADSAYTSQALIQLYNEYCIPKKCLECRIGNVLITK